MDKNAINKLSYGLFIITAKENNKDNGCIVNTVSQVTTNPDRIIVAINKNNYTHDMIMNTKKFNVSVLTENSKFETFKHWGFQSGRDSDKTIGISFERADNNIIYISEECNAYIQAEVESTQDLGTHTLFIAKVVDAVLLSDEESVTYSYYHKNIKPKQNSKPKQTGYICTICGYIYEGETLPEDFICPLCKHPASDFKKLQIEIN